MERPRHRLAPLLLVVLLGLVGGAATATGADAQAACEPTNLATQIALFCAPDMPTAPCCEPVVASVDLGGGVGCLCRVAAQPQLVLARLNASRLLTLYIACGGLRTGGPSPRAIPVVAPPPPVAHRHGDAPPPSATAQSTATPEQHPGAASQSQVPAAAAKPLLRGLFGGAAVTTGVDTEAACEPTNLATQIALFCAPDMPTAPCCEPVVASVDLGGGVGCLCRVAAQPQLVLARLNASHLLALYTACGGLRTGGGHLAAACQGPSHPAVHVVTPPLPFALSQKLSTRDTPTPSRATAQPSPMPQQQPGDASQGKALPTQEAATPSPHVPAAAPHGLRIFIFAYDLVSTIRIAGVIISCMIFASHVCISLEIARNKDVGQNGPYSYAATFLSCAFSAFYASAMIRLNVLISMLNSFGAAVELIYVIIYCVYAPGSISYILLVMAISVLSLMLVIFLIISLSWFYVRRLVTAGIVCAFCGVVKYLVPLWTLYEAISAHSVKSMSLLQSILSFLNALCWSIYAYLVSDYFILGPSCIGILAGTCQILGYIWIIWYYPEQDVGSPDDYDELGEGEEVGAAQPS